MDYQPVVDGDALPQPPIDAIRAGSSANIDPDLLAAIVVEVHVSPAHLDP